ncbi:ubiquitin 3 binding protein But2 C-terminal domain-containing protein [Dendryphion nanum]|uniref:Ubiquitin 3 binding protein But2 C-terminal domain-containing protein n=1 Tax=Dendryphion nanum TaxID=256645 RepID=A0A9P9EEE9_9PLEO|nr:ubiquitin 3 binding protein But2 C-terminal domain-containing protein [Dendryphion nanum]
MKTIAILTSLLTTTLALPATSSPTLSERTFDKKQCPCNPFQPDGQLPQTGVINTSVLVPISAKQPNKAFPDSPWAKITPKDFCTIFNLDLPVAATQGKICSLVFDFPSVLQAPGLFWFSGPGDFTFTGYAINAGAVPGETTFNKQPAPGPSPPNPPKFMKPGNSYVINSAPCGIPANIPGSVTVSGSLCSEKTTFSFKQSDYKCPLGFYVILTEDPNAGQPH